MDQLEELKREGLSITEIASETGFDRKTIRKYRSQKSAVPTYKPRPEAASKLDKHKPYIGERLSAGVWNAVVVLRELRERGYDGSYTILKDHLRPLRRAARTTAVRRFETPPGKQAQVDWGHLGSITDGEDRKQQLWGLC